MGSEVGRLPPASWEPTVVGGHMGQGESRELGTSNRNQYRQETETRMIELPRLERSFPGLGRRNCGRDSLSAGDRFGHIRHMHAWLPVVIRRWSQFTDQSEQCLCIEVYIAVYPDGYGTPKKTLSKPLAILFMNWTKCEVRHYLVHIVLRCSKWKSSERRSMVMKKLISSLSLLSSV